MGKFLIDGKEPAVRILEPYHPGLILDDGRKMGFSLSQQCLRLLAFGDVVEQNDYLSGDIGP